MKPALTSFGGAVLIFLLVLSMYAVWHSRVETRSAEVGRLENDLANKNQAVNRITSARATLERNNDPAHSLSKYFVAETDAAPFIALLEGVAEREGTELEVIAVSADGTKVAPALLFTLGVEGSFNPLMQTLGIIEYAPYDISFVGMTLSKGEKKLWRAEVRLRVGSK
jgi:hypothetical protein